jgi:hypothetical protein
MFCSIRFALDFFRHGKRGLSSPDFLFNFSSRFSLVDFNFTAGRRSFFVGLEKECTKMHKFKFREGFNNTKSRCTHTHRDREWKKLSRKKSWCQACDNNARSSEKYDPSVSEDIRELKQFFFFRYRKALNAALGEGKHSQAERSYPKPTHSTEKTEISRAHITIVVVVFARSKSQASSN